MEMPVMALIANGVVAETYTQVTLRVELETGEPLVWADLVDGEGIGLQVH
jgi:hypothetical protein